MLLLKHLFTNAFNVFYRFLNFNSSSFNCVYTANFFRGLCFFVGTFMKGPRILPCSIYKKATSCKNQLFTFPNTTISSKVGVSLPPNGSIVMAKACIPCVSSSFNLSLSINPSSNKPKSFGCPSTMAHN